MIRFYFHPTPNPAKIALFLEEAGLSYEAIPVDTSKGEQHSPSFRTINPNGKVPAIVDTEGPGARETRVFDSTAILIYLAEKTGKFLGAPEDRPELLSWLLFIASGLDAALVVSPRVLIAGVCMRQVLERLSRSSALSIYVQRITPMGVPVDFDMLEAETGDLSAAAVELTAFFPNAGVLDREVMRYHQRYKPSRNADVIFVRKETS